MLVAGREIYKVNRKRKREYAPYEVSKEEVKEYQKKRPKPMNYENSYNREEIWKKNDQEDFENEMEKIEDEMKDKDNKSMNVDKYSIRRCLVPPKRPKISQICEGGTRQRWFYFYFYFPIFFYFTIFIPKVQLEGCFIIASSYLDKKSKQK